jgi:hypothetical protein
MWMVDTLGTALAPWARVSAAWTFAFSAAWTLAPGCVIQKPKMKNKTTAAVNAPPIPSIRIRFRI